MSFLRGISCLYFVKLAIDEFMTNLGEIDKMKLNKEVKCVVPQRIQSY